MRQAMTSDWVSVIVLMVIVGIYARIITSHTRGQVIRAGVAALAVLVAVFIAINWRM